MKRSVSVVVKPKFRDGPGSVATLLSSMKKTDSKSLAWPTSKDRAKRSYSRIRKGSQFSDTPLAESAISHLRMHKEREQINKTQLDKSKFYYFLKYNESKDSMAHKNRSRSILSTASINGSSAWKLGRRISSYHHIKPNTSVYMVPPQHSVYRHSQARPTDIKDIIYRMLQDISFRKATETRRKRVKRSKPVEKVSHFLDLEFKSKEKFLPQRRRKVKGSEILRISFLDSSNRSKKKKTKMIRSRRKRKKQPPTLDLSVLDPKGIKKAKKFKRFTKLADKEREPVDSKEIVEYLKTIRKSHDSSADYKRRSLSHRSMSIDSSADRRRSKKKSQLIQKYDFVNREILKSLQDPEIIDEFLKNIKKLATKECTLFRKRFMENEKVRNLEKPSDIDQYLDDINKLVRKARLSIQKRQQDKNSLEGDDISRDLKNIEKLPLKVRTISKSRKVLEEGEVQSPIEADITSYDPSVTTISSDTVPWEKPYTNEKSQIRQSKYDETLKVQPRLRIELAEFDSDLEENLPFVPPISYEEMAKLSPEEFKKLFSGLKKDVKSIEFLKSSLASLKADLPLTYNYRVDQIKRYLGDSDVQLSDLDNISMDDIDINEFLNYPYSEKYTDESIEPKLSPRVPIRKIAATRKFKIEQRTDEDGHKVPKVKEKKELNDFKVQPSDLPKKHTCCICNSIKLNKPIKDDPLIIRMKNEMKRLELKAYIKEQQISQNWFDKISNNAQFNFDNCRVLVPCRKPPTVCNQIYPANVFYRNKS